MGDQIEELRELKADHIGRKVRPGEIFRIKLVTFDGGSIHASLNAGSSIAVSKGSAGFYIAEIDEDEEGIRPDPFLRETLASRIFKYFSSRDPNPPADHYQVFPEALMPNSVNEQDMRAVTARMSELASAQFDKSQTYTTVTMVAGYAGFIALWDKVAQQLAPFANAAVGLSVGISLASFVLFEVFKMYLIGQAQLPFLQMNTLRTWEQKFAKLVQIENNQARVNLFMQKIWKITFPIALATGLTGISILLVALVIKAAAPLFA